jgi:phage baseplate assembly protein W
MAFEIKQYLFEPLSVAKAWFLGYEICQLLPMYEPRVSIQQLKVTANPNDSSYTIVLRIAIPSLDKELDINSVLSKDGYAILG